MSVLKLDGKIAATGCCVENYITRVYVLPEHHKKSYGTFIVKNIEGQICGSYDRAYLKRALENGEHIAYLLYDNGTFIGAGGLSFYQVMPTYHNLSGKKAYIMNVYTASEYRRQGIAFFHHLMIEKR